MNDQFKDQVAIITGGASGIGLAIAKKLHNEGASVAMIDLNVAALLSAPMPVGENAYACDVTNEDQVKSVVDQIAERFGRIDILVNSAGVTGKTNIKTHEVELSDFRFVFDINVVGSFLTSRAVLPHMLKRNYGRILHIASIAGKEGNAGMLAYSVSKAAVIGMAKAQGKEYAETGITVNALAPAVIRTAMVEALPEEQVKYMTDKIPMKRCGTLEEIAHLAAFIVSPGASFTTGFTFDMTGGRATY
ncbi:MAG TPA: SDR family NAD(P)-dependent oxidoreductase [Blastocatellia bacterium]|jgi:3-oxoacyl-[acyl-carrier protein] reductase|nr:SDR family NAD(P)-dependent oxidoreductase [Blastocatellia bacterium]